MQKNGKQLAELRKCTREWLEHLSKVKNNSNAKEILAYIERLEKERDASH